MAGLLSSVVNLTLLYTDSEAVIPAKAGIQFRNTGFRVKPGMTNMGKTFLNHYTSVREQVIDPILLFTLSFSGEALFFDFS